MEVTEGGAGYTKLVQGVKWVDNTWYPLYFVTIKHFDIEMQP